VKQAKNSLGIMRGVKFLLALFLAALIFIGYRKYHTWDIDGLMGFYEVWGNFPDQRERQFMRLVLEGDVDAVLAEAKTVPGGVNATGTEGLTPLMIAVRHLDMPMVKALLKAGAKPDGAKWWVPLASAVRAYDLDYARTLLAAGANPDGLSSARLPLAEAAMIDYRDGVDLLLKSGAHVDAKDDGGETAVITTAASGQIDMVNYLLDRGASIWTATRLGHTVANLGGETCMHLAINDPKVHADCQRLLDRLHAAHYPWPPPKAAEMERLVKEGKWPPKEAQGH